MNSLDLSAAYLGGSAVTAMYFGANKLWPQEAPVVTTDLLLYGYTGTQSQLAARLTGETITSYSVTNNTASVNFAPGTSYSFNSQWNFDTSIVKIIDSGKCTGTNGFIQCTSLTEVVLPGLTNQTPAIVGCTNLTSVSFANAVQLGSSTFNASAALIKYINIPKVYSVGTNMFWSQTPPESGSIWINTAVQSDPDWNTSGNLQLLQSQGWTINYVN